MLSCQQEVYCNSFSSRVSDTIASPFYLNLILTFNSLLSLKNFPKLNKMVNVQRPLAFISSALFSTSSKTAMAASSTTCPTSFYDIKEIDASGNTVDFNRFKGKVVYAVNVASK